MITITIDITRSLLMERRNFDEQEPFLGKHKWNSRCSRMFFQRARLSYLSRSPYRGPRGGCCSDPIVAATKQRCSRSAYRRLSPATIPRRSPNTANTGAALIIPLIINRSAANPQRGWAECEITAELQNNNKIMPQIGAGNRSCFARATRRSSGTVPG